MNSKYQHILVTGGTGYIGSHTVIELLNQGYHIDILDNLINSKITALDKIEQITGQRPNFYQIDLLDQPAVNQLFQDNHYDLVMHFAGLKAVAESVAKPLEYYENNVTGTINLLKTMQAHDVNKFIFSSSAAVYGDPGIPEYTEALPTGQNISSPYGKTKYMIEEILRDLASANPKFQVISLRYFNPIGNHPSGLIGEDPNGMPNNLMPLIMKVARGELGKLQIYGNDHPTPDGTCRRDYIHVIDLAKGHLTAIDGLKPGFNAYNLGTNHPTSVLEMVHTFEKLSGKPLPFTFTAHRPGDLPEFWANPAKANQELNWHTELSVEDAIKDTLSFLNHR